MKDSKLTKTIGKSSLIVVLIYGKNMIKFILIS